MALQHAEITEKIIGAFFAVYKALGYGFLEKVYANALTAEVLFRKISSAKLYGCPLEQITCQDFFDRTLE